VNLKNIQNDASALIRQAGGTPLTMHEYASMKYPKLIPFMKFDLERFYLEEYGQILFMHTGTKVGMELLTIVCMPYEGKNIPFLLVDAMQMKKKKIVFVEYYDCTRTKERQDRLEEVYQKYKDLPDYAEKPAWYIRERTSYSLIKGSENDLTDMIVDSLKAYLTAVSDADQANKEENRNGLLLFRNRMITEGNPASQTLNKVLGKEKAVTFFQQYVMPMEKGV